MLRLAGAIDRLTTAIGRGAAWLVLILVLLQFLIVLLRYVFGLGSVWLQEAVVYTHAFAFLLAAAWALAIGAHVRVDIFYRDAKPRARALIDLFGAIVFLLPMTGLILWLSLPYAARSWAILERSRETAGIPAVFLLKTAIPLFAALLILQGIAQILRAAARLGGRRES